MSYPHQPNEPNSNPFREDEFQDLIKNCLPDKNFNLDKVTRRILLQLAHTFLEETLDLPPSQKSNLNTQAINRQLAIKFPEVARSAQNIEMQQKRNNEIDKEDML